MAGKFNGISDEMWAFLEPHVSRKHAGGGRICDNYRNILNSIFWILITGARWCDIPNDSSIFAPRSSAHRWIKRWEADGTWAKIQTGLIEAAYISHKIDWGRITIDGSFSPRTGRR
jgi:transposase